ncbi:MAG: hypothetical protein QGG64_15990 [Candidatus Latescibacteria bacterium]|nr:hypothetical protein [Candidatus Latescibacterota bacterium]
MSGMSNLGPWIALKSMPNLNATNTLYVAKFKKNLTLEEKSAWCISFLCSYTRDKLDSLGRHYPDGLLKYEKRDLGEVKLIEPNKIDGAIKKYREIVHLMLEGNIDESRLLADEGMGINSQIPQTMPLNKRA